MGKQLTIVSGRITEPQWSTTKNGKNFLKFSIPVQLTIGRGEQATRESVFYTIRVWDPAAQRLAPMLHTGAVVQVSGVVRTTAYTRQDGQTALNNEFMFGYKIDILHSDNMQSGQTGQSNQSNRGYNQNSGGQTNSGYNRGQGYNQPRQNNNQNNQYDEDYNDGGYDEYSSPNSSGQSNQPARQPQQGNYNSGQRRGYGNR